MFYWVHKIYVLLGCFLCKIGRIYWCLRDSLFPPKAKAVLFVAHPDDDTLFFHTFIKAYHPYVVLMTTGWCIKRVPDFIKVMHRYGVKFRIYELIGPEVSVDDLAKCVRAVLSVGNFEIVATHNSEGEYGNSTHQKVHSAVKSVYNGKILNPVYQTEINCYPVNKLILEEKMAIFNDYYISEKFVLEQYSDWVRNEKLVYDKDKY